METKSVSDFSVFCPVCGIEQNLYDIAEGRCMICGADLTAEKKKLMKVLLAQDIFFDCDENGHIIVPESVVKPEAPAANPEDLAVNPEDPAVKPGDPAVLHFKGQFSEIEYYKHKVIQIPDEGKLIVQVYFHFKNLAGKPKCFLDCSQMQLFQHGMSKDFYPSSTDTESLNAGIVILPGYSLDVAKGFEIQDYSDVLLRYVPWDEDFDLEFTQTLRLEKGETSDGFDMAFLENKLVDFLRDIIHEKLLQDNNYVRLMRQFERKHTEKSDEQGLDAALMVFFLNWMHDHLTEEELQAAADRRKKQEQEMEGPLEIVIDLADLGYGDNEDYADHVSDGDDDWDSDDDDWASDDGGDWEIEDLDDVEEESEFYEPPVDYEDEDAIALDMEEAIDDAIMSHGGNPFDWDTRSDFLDDPLSFGDDDA